MPIAKALSIVKISKHQYYYRKKGTKQGIKASLTTQTTTGKSIDNSEIVSEIKKMYENPDTQYGYIKKYLINYYYPAPHVCEELLF